MKSPMAISYGKVFDIEHDRSAFLFDVDGVISRWLSGLPRFLESKKLPNQHVIDALKKNEFLSLTYIFSTNCEHEARRLLDEYNASDAIAELEPFERDTGHTLRAISELGDLIAITCIGVCLQSHQNRIRNLENICGGQLFSEVHCLDFDVSKEDVIRNIAERRRVAFFVDDRQRHVEEAKSAGVVAYHFVSGVPLEDRCPSGAHANSWSHIKELAERHVATIG